MYFWKINNLKTDIINDSLSEKDKFIYAAIYIVSCAIGMEAMAWLPIEDTNIWDVISSLSNILIVLVGTIFAFIANGGRNGTDFLGRFFSIGFIITVRFLVLLIPLFIVIMLYYYYTADENSEVTTSAAAIAPFLIWYAALYWRIYVHINDIKNT